MSNGLNPNVMIASPEELPVKAPSDQLRVGARMVSSTEPSPTNEERDKIGRDNPAAPAIACESSQNSTNNGSPRDRTDQTLYLIGRPTLKQFLRFMSREAARCEDEGSLIAE